MRADPNAEAARAHRSVLEHLRRGEVRRAAETCASLTERWPEFLPGWTLAAGIALRGGDAPSALAHVTRALRLEPGRADLLVLRAQALPLGGDSEQARAVLDGLARTAADDARLQHAIGSLYSAMGFHQQALEAASRAVELDPARAQYQFNRAALLRFVGRLEEAEATYDRALAIEPDDHEAWLNRAELRRQTPERNHIAALEARVTRRFAHPRDEVFIRYALAKELEDVGRYRESFVHLLAGATLRRRHIDYDLQRDLRTVDLVVGAFPASRLGALPRAAAAGPIFVLGLPRSGTTLVERILGSHPAVHGAGELLTFPEALVAAVERAAGRSGVPREDMVRTAASIDLRAVGEDYLARSRRHAGSRPRFVDKLPHNYLYCGLIHEALPGARIVHVLRHPMASCHAMFKALFRQGYPFSYDLDELAQFYAGYRRLMDHWRRAMPGVIHDVRYEELVRSPREVTCSLLEFCGLDWHEGCLEFHTNPAPSTTASAAQVRRPLYASSVELWKNYRTELAPLEARLRACGIDLDEA
ncbi:MAG: sulfotransferase [Pseudomonadota bacterium]